MKCVVTVVSGVDEPRGDVGYVLRASNSEYESSYNEIVVAPPQKSCTSASTAACGPARP